MAKKKTMRKTERVPTILKKNSQIEIRGVAKIINYKPAKVLWITHGHIGKSFLDIKSYEIDGLKLKFVRTKPGKKDDIDLKGVLELVRRKGKRKKKKQSKEELMMDLEDLSDVSYLKRHNG